MQSNNDSMTLVDAIGKILNSNDQPMPIAELVDVINSGYFENLDDYEDVDEEEIQSCVRENQNLFDLRNSLVSIKGQKHSEKQLWGIIERLRGEFGSEGYDLFIVLLFYFRFDAIRDEFGFDDPENSVKNLLHELKLTYSNQTVDDLLWPLDTIFYKKFKKHTHDFSNHGSVFEIHKFEIWGDDNLPKKFCNLLSTYDWSLNAISKSTFDDFLHKLFENLIHRKSNYDNYLPRQLSSFIPELIDKRDIDNVLDLNTQLGELTSQYYIKYPGDYDVSITHSNPRNLVISAMRLILMGVKEISLLEHPFLAIDDFEYDLLITNPPWGRLTKKYWEELLETKDVEIGSLEELYVKIGFAGLRKNGEAYIVVPDGFLFRNTKSLESFRKKLAKDKNIKSIIYLPKGLFSPFTGINTTLMVLSKSENQEFPLLINTREINPQSRRNTKQIFKKAFRLYKEKKEEVGVSRFVSWNEFENENFNFGPNRFFNPKVYSELYGRDENEEILNLSEITNRLKLPRKEVDGSLPLMNMSNLADDPVDYVLDISNRSTKSEYNSKLMVLDRDAVLIGKVGNNLKPSLFKYEGKPIYMGKNVIALEPGEDLDPEYLISELNSEFVNNQIKRLPKGSTIPNIRIKDLMNVYVRVPQSISKQASHFKDWIKKVAKSRVAKIENINSRLKLVERDIISGFKHDFMQILGNVSSGLNNISNYIHSLSEREVISLDEPVSLQFPGEEVKPEETIKSTIERVQYNVQSAIDFLEVEMDRLVSGVDKSKFYEVELYQFLKEWKQGVNIDDTYSVRIEKSEGWPSKGIIVCLVPALFKTVLRNLLNNAIKHGFTEDKSDYEFVLTVGLIEEREGFFARLLIRNNGKPFPNGYTFNDFVKSRTSAGKNRGTGLGGATVKRLIEEHDGIFRKPDNPMPEEMWPVQFEILIPMVET